MFLTQVQGMRIECRAQEPMVLSFPSLSVGLAARLLSVLFSFSHFPPTHGRLKHEKGDHAQADNPTQSQKVACALIQKQLEVWALAVE